MIINMLKIISTLILTCTVFLDLVIGKCPNTDPNKCEYGENTKKFYVMGPTGVGKSTFVNVMTGHRQDENRCFVAGFIEGSRGGVTKTVKDEGCFKLQKDGIWSKVLIGAFLIILAVIVILLIVARKEGDCVVAL